MWLRTAPWFFQFVFCVFVFLTFAPEPAFAQNTATTAQHSTVDVDVWDRLASRTERLLDDGAPSEAVLIGLRSQLVEQRSSATDLVERGSVAVRALQAQLNAMGPPPEDGEAEAVAARRTSLIEALAQANAPVLSAQQALERTDVLIAEIDRLLRSRSVSELLVHLPSPLNPFNWPHALSAITSGIEDAITALTGSPIDREDAALANVWLGAAMIVLGLAGLSGLHSVLSRQIERRLQRIAIEDRKAGLLFAYYAERLLVPLLSGLLAAGGVAMIGIGRLSPELLGVVLAIPAGVAFANWIGHLAFSPAYPPARLIRIRPESGFKGVLISQGLGWALIFQSSLKSFYAAGQIDGAGYAVLTLVVIAASTALLWLLADILGDLSDDHDPADGLEDTHTPMQIMSPVVMLIRACAVIGLAGALIGYVGVAQQAVFPAIFSLEIIVLTIGLYHLLLSLPFIALNAHEKTDQAVPSAIPVVLGVVLAIALVPVLALIWGARVTDISEIWTIAIQGVDISGLRVSLPSVLLLVVVFAIGLFATHWLQVIVRNTVLPRTRADAGVRTAVVTFIGYFGVLLAAIIAASAAGVDLSDLALVAGALSVGIGFGLQAIVANFLSGLILLVERPIKEGDWIEVGNYSGTVKKIAVRSTRVETFDRHDVIIPNSDLIAGTVKNMTLGSRTGRVVCPVAVAYGTDIDLVRAALTEIATAHPLVLNRPAPVVLLRAFGDNALEIELRCFIRDVMETITVKSDLQIAIYKRFLLDEISIPFPQRDVHIIDAKPKPAPRRKTKNA